MSEAVRGTGQGAAAPTGDIKAIARFALRKKGRIWLRQQGPDGRPGQPKRSPPAVKVHMLMAIVSSTASSEVKCVYSHSSWR